VFPRFPNGYKKEQEERRKKERRLGNGTGEKEMGGKGRITEKWMRVITGKEREEDR